MCEVLPSYELKSPRTIKRTILKMYVVVRQLIISYLALEDCRFSITFDGWSNRALSTFYLVTLHWVSPESAKPMSMLLDFLHVFPGEGVGKHCGLALFRRLKSFGLGSRLLCTISDNGSDTIVASKELGKLLYETYSHDILPSSHMLRCIVTHFN